MSTAVTIFHNPANGEAPLSASLAIPDEALAQVNFNFNPSGNREVTIEKILAAAVIAHIDAWGKDGRSASLAKTNIEQGSMWGVKSITHGT